MSEEIRQPLHVRNGFRDRAMNVLAYWWFAQVGSTPMRPASMLARMQMNDVGYRAVCQFCEHADPCKKILSSRIAQVMGKGRYECLTQDKRYRMRTIYSVSGVQFQVMPERSSA